MSKQDIIDRIRKVKRLAEDGIEGEKEAAKARVEELMQRYNITDEDLEEDKEYLRTYFIDGVFCWKLFMQIAIVKFGVKKMLNLNKMRVPREHREVFNTIASGKKYNVAILCTAAQFIELTAYYEIVQRGLEEQAEAFFFAFLDRNQLLAQASESDKNKEISEKEAEMVRRAMLMSRGIDKVVVNKLIEQ